MHIALLLYDNTFMSFLVIKKQIGPGPAHLIDPVMTRYGRDGTPHYSLHSRHKELKAFMTPGPGAHCPEKFADPYTRRPPAYSMGGRTKYRKSINNQFCLSHDYSLL